MPGPSVRPPSRSDPLLPWACRGQRRRCGHREQRALFALRLMRTHRKGPARRSSRAHCPRPSLHFTTVAGTLARIVEDDANPLGLRRSVEMNMTVRDDSPSFVRGTGPPSRCTAFSTASIATARRLSESTKLKPFGGQHACRSAATLSGREAPRHRHAGWCACSLGDSLHVWLPRRGRHATFIGLPSCSALHCRSLLGAIRCSRAIRHPSVHQVNRRNAPRGAHRA